MYSYQTFNSKCMNQIKNQISLYFLSFIFIQLGLLLYNNFRSKEIWINKWTDLYDFNLSNHISLPNWFIYSSTDFLWSMSGSILMFSIWKSELIFKNYFWIYSIVLVSFLHEFLQYYGIMKGTFDVLDVFSYLLSSIILILMIILTKKNKL